MPDSLGRTYYKSYNASFIVPADPFRFNLETKAIPRRRDLRQVNLKEDITRGWRATLRPSMWADLADLPPDEKERIWELPDERQLTKTGDSGDHLFFKQYKRYYRRIDSISEKSGLSFIVRHFFHKARSPNTKLKWYLAQYAQDAKVNYLQFDLDMHGEWTPGAWALLQRQVASFEETVSSLGGKVVWTTSPGDVYGGQHIQGLYAWIKLDGFHKVAELTQLKNRIKRALNLPLDTEYSWDHAYRAIRLGGQQYVELVNPRTMHLLAPIADEEPQRKSFDAFCEAWHSAKPIRLDHLLALDPNPERVNPVLSKRTKPASKPLPSRTTGEPHLCPEFVKENTWQIALKTVSETMHRHQGVVHLAEEEAIRLLPERCRIGSRTCGDPVSLRSLVGRIASRFSKSFKPRNERRAADRERYRRHSIDVDIEDVIRVLDGHLPIHGMKNKLRQYLRALKTHQGRVACKIIYDAPDAIFSKREWFRLTGRVVDCLFIDPFKPYSPKRKKLLDFVCVIDGSSYLINKCRQYGFSSLLLQELRELRKSKARARALVEKHSLEETTPTPNVIITRTPPEDTALDTPIPLDTESVQGTGRGVHRGKRWISALGNLPLL